MLAALLELLALMVICCLLGLREISISSTTLIDPKSFLISFFNLTVVGIALFFGDELFFFFITTTGDGTEPALNSLIFSSIGYCNLYC